MFSDNKISPKDLTHTNETTNTSLSDKDKASCALQIDLSLDTVFELVPDSTLVINQAGRILFANTESSAFFGFSVEELIAQTIEDLVPECHQQVLAQHRSNCFDKPALKHQEKRDTTLQLRRKDGVEIPCDINLSPLNTGDDIMVICSIRDMSDFSNTQANLRKTEKYQRLLLETTNAIPWEADARTWQMTYIGPQVLGLLGYTAEQWKESDFWVLNIHPDDRDRTVSFCEQSSQTLDNYEIEYRMIAADERVVWVRDIVSVIRVNGETEQLRGFMIDVTEAKEINVALESTLDEVKALKGKLENLCDNAPVGLCYLDTELRFVHINEYLARMNGFPVDYHIGRKVTEILPDVVGIELKLRNILDGEQSVIEERVQGTTSDNTGTSRVVSYYPDKADGGQIVGIRCVVKDVSKINKLELENAILREEIKLSYPHKEILGQSVVTKKLLKLVEQVAPTEASVLLEGETGTGKELIAREIHQLSAHSSKTMVTVNCAALPATLIESELFGREKGAFTGALAKQLGRFEIANNSTIFLDEIGELPLELQPKLLRVLQEGEFERLGGAQTIKVNVRVVAATNQNLEELVSQGLFRRDLYYRLSAFPVAIPPLRKRADDIPELVWSFVSKYNNAMGKRIEIISEPMMQKLAQYSWPGNIRELRNVIERSMILSSDRTLNVLLPEQNNMDFDMSSSMQLEDVEKAHIEHVLEKTKWRVRGEQGAADILGLKPTTLESKMTKLGIRRL
ncbi:MAG: PAS domain S-box-containing protein [Paraglaciecola sp.]|jgi:PAS domain S-box-containing protein